MFHFIWYTQYLVNIKYNTKNLVINFMLLRKLFLCFNESWFFNDIATLNRSVWLYECSHAYVGGLCAIQLNVTLFLVVRKLQYLVCVFASSVKKMKPPRALCPAGRRYKGTRWNKVACWTWSVSICNQSDSWLSRRKSNTKTHCIRYAGAGREHA